MTESSSRWNRRLARSVPGLLFMLPALAVYLTFVVYPFLQTIGISLTNWDGLSATRDFVGLANFRRLFTADANFRQAFQNNLYWVFLGTFAPVALALPLAALVSARGVRGRAFFRTVYFLPVVLPAMVVAVIWSRIYNPLIGLLNPALEAIGLGHLTRAWLGDPATALTALIVSAVWAYFGFCFVIFVAGIQNVDESLHEAAMLDGATALQRFFHVTVPQLRDVTTMVVVYTFIGGFTGVFDIVWVSTRGGPGNATEVLATALYRQAFEYYEFGSAAAMAVVLSLIVVSVSVVIVRMRERGA